QVSPAFRAELAARLGQPDLLGLADWRAWTMRLAPAAAALVVAALYAAMSPGSAALTLDEWAALTAGRDSEAALLWQADATTDSVLQEMLAVEPAPEGVDER